MRPSFSPSARLVKRLSYPFISLLVTGLLMCSITAHSAVVVTPGNGYCLPFSPGTFTAIGNIVITENAIDDFANQSGVTIILSAPAGFEFQAGVGTVSFTAGRNISSASITVTSSAITVTYSCPGTNRADVLTISGIQARGTAALLSGTILRTGGTANISGNNPSDLANHGNLTSNGSGTSVASVTAGNWASPSTWSTGTVPVCGQNVTISHNVTLDAAADIANLTIQTGGTLTANAAITVQTNFTINGTGTYVHNNTANASTTVFAGTESFSSTSNLIFNQWYSLSTPLGSLVSNSFGNITFNVTGNWQQNGMFSPNRIQGNITISNGSLYMDNGTGMTTSLTLKDVTINGSGNLKMCTGTNRNFTLTTNSFTDISSNTTFSTLMEGCTGNFSWIANGNVHLEQNFGILDNCGTSPGANITINGKMTVGSGNIYILKNSDAPTTFTVTDSIIVSGSSGLFSWTNTGTLPFTMNAGSIHVTGANTFNFISGSFSGTNQINVTRNFEITGANTTVYLINNTTYNNQVNLSVGNDIIVTNSRFFVANTNGQVNIQCNRNITISGGTAIMKVQIRTSCLESVSLTANGTFRVINNATFIQSHGQGNIDFIIAEFLIIDNGIFYGVNHTAQPAAALATFAFTDFIFRGGFVQLFTLKASTATIVTVNCSNDFDIEWKANTDLVELISYDGSNDALLDLNIGGSLIINGNYPNATFLSSKAGGMETVDIAGNFSISGGRAFFVCNNNNTSGIDAHNIVTNIGGNLNVSGGELFLSTRQGTADVTVSGNVNITGGILNLKWLTGRAFMTINGNYVQSGGNFNIHSHTGANPDTCRVIVNGNFTQTAGVFNFDTRSGSNMAENELIINGPNFTIGGSGSFTHGNNLSANYVHGHIYFNRTGTITYSRTSPTHDIQHIRQTINSQTTVNASSSTNGFQITSVASSTASVHNMLTIRGTLDMGDKILSSRQYANYYSQLTVSSGGKYRTSHVNGLYTGSAVLPGSINGFINGLNRANYSLDLNSTVEYYGTANVSVTGIPNGIATANSNKYGRLEINITGTPDMTWAYPETANEVYIRNSLILTNGEFNLDSDHNPTGGGRPILLENGATIARTAGYLRSETEDGSGLLRWNITANGSYVIPFGYDAANYIPFTYQQTSGNSGTIAIATYHTVATNLPLPPTVTHVNDVFGNNNSLNTVDRFWYISVPGSASGNLTFSFTSGEKASIISPRAQLWEPVSRGWFPPMSGQNNPTATTTFTPGISSFNNWWTLSAASSPLPVDLLSFKASVQGDQVNLDWATATEINNDYFTVERSKNGSGFEPLGIVSGAGNSSSVIHYSFTDHHPLQGPNYYRIKQTDYDGQYSYSETRLVLFREELSYSVYPNPIGVFDNLNITPDHAGNFKFQIIDQHSRLVYEKHYEISEGEGIYLNLATINLTAGVFYLRLISDSEGVVTKLVVKN
jgi:hypothetical protein